MVAREPSALLRNIIRDAARIAAVSGGLTMMRTRRDEFPSQIACDLAGLYMDPVSRAYVRERLRLAWSQVSGEPTEPDREHILGGGLHAAVYAGTRAAMGFQAPVVWEMERPGGAFSVGGGQPVFWLQSRNRPGPPGIPEMGNLNYIPGAVVQPSHIARGEYPDNSEVSWCVEMTLAAYADVRKDTVTDCSPMLMTVTALEAGISRARRIIDARGMGAESTMLLPEAELRRHVVTFQELMNRMGGPFPLRGIRRVAVIGGGASGRAAVESLVGIAPVSHYSAPELDWVRQIDWYAPGVYDSREEWLRNEQRSRSLEISRFLPRQDEDEDGNYQPERKSESRRVRVFSQMATPLDGPDSASVGLRGYDLVVVCTGVRRRAGGIVSVPSPENWPVLSVTPQASPIARRYDGNSQLYAVGTAASLPVPSDQAAAALSVIPGNDKSIFFLAPKTAQLAMMLGG